MFDTFDFMVFNWYCILGGPYYSTLPYIDLVNIVYTFQDSTVHQYGHHLAKSGIMQSQHIH